MTKEQEYIVKLSKAAIFEEQPEEPSENFDWEYIWSKAAEQNISGLLASAILRLPEDKQPKNKNDWQRIMMETMFVMGRKFAEFERMMKRLADSDIEPICLKGIVVKDLYPIPELRTMGDFDIWVEKEQRETAEKVFADEGYSLYKDTLYSAMDKNGIHGELFVSLEDDFREQPEYWNDLLKSNTVCDTTGRRILNDTYELAYSIIHTAKHLTREGCGIRNILDAVLILIKKRESIDLHTVENICRAQGYEKVFVYILSAAEQWYGVSIEFEFERICSDLFLEYLLCYGIFGRSIEGNGLTKQVARREGDNVSMFRRMFFPPRKMMWHKYQYLKKSPLLTPVAWVHRIITAVFVKKYSLKKMASGIGESVNYGKDRAMWLSRLDIH